MRSLVQRTAQFAALAACAYFIAAPDAAHADWIVASDAVARHNDNVGNVNNAFDRVADSSVTAKLSVYQLLPIGADYSLGLGASLGGEVYDRLSGLSNGSADAVVSLRKKWGLGALAPWMRIQTSLGRTIVDDGYRDATVYRDSVAVGKRLDSGWNLRAEYAYERRAANPQAEHAGNLSSDVFSTQGRSAQLGAEYLLSERFILVAGALRRSGDIIVSSSPWTYLSARAFAIAPDPSFGAHYLAYRLGGETSGLRLGLEFSPSPHSLLGVGFLRTDTHAQGGNDYTSSIPEVMWNYRF
jgi:hypothetical protein